MTDALILIDLQNDYHPGGLWPVPGIEAATAQAARVLAHARGKGTPVIHVRHEARSPDAPFFRPGTPGAEINAGVAPVPSERVVTKAYPNSFRETDLGAMLAESGAKRLMLVGAMTQMCIDATARAAADQGYEVTVVSDACAARAVTYNGVEVEAEAVHAAFLGALSGTYAHILTTDAVLAASD